MKTYTIRFYETHIREIEVKANSEEEAEQFWEGADPCIPVLRVHD